MSERTPHPRNVPGDFYVEDGCCLACGVPRKLAPELFALADAPQAHCFVARQPVSPAELDRMLEAVRGAELDCIRYRGRDLAIQVRLIDVGKGGQCDALLPELVRRNAELAKAARRKLLLERWKGKLAKLAGWRP